MSQSRPVLTLTLTAAAAITAERFITAAGDVPAAGARVLGAARSNAAAGELLPVDVLGTAIVELGAAVAQGDAVQSDAQGRAIVLAAGTAAGIALQAGNTGDRVEILLR